LFGLASETLLVGVTIKRTGPDRTGQHRTDTGPQSSSHLCFWGAEVFSSCMAALALSWFQIRVSAMLIWNQLKVDSACTYSMFPAYSVKAQAPGVQG